jgi:isoamylase
MHIYPTEPGTAHPLGAVADEHGVNFAIFSEHGTSVELLLFARPDDPQPFQIIPLKPERNLTFHRWHVYVRGLRSGVAYAYRFDGRNDGYGEADRFDKSKVLLDPYARAISTKLWRRADACVPGDNVHTSMRGLVVDPSGYDWEGDQLLRQPMAETIIYEVHVGGFTQSPSSNCQYPGTFAGLVEKIPYLKELGITAVELMPIFAFDEQSAKGVNPHDGKPLTNFWGYNPVAYFAPHPAYGRAPDTDSVLEDFRTMVKALHRAGIEVIIDVVFNHTAEGDELGPTFSFRGIDNRAYYLQSTVDFTGCGNTFKCNHPIVVKLIADCLEYWIKEMHVDGFRFDLASILTRGGDGRPLPYPPVLWYIELAEVLADAKLIVEAWDAVGLYQVGSFPGYRWAEWNGRYRDHVRRFVRGDPGMVGAIATSMTGSADLYQPRRRLPLNSINFITCHDGFTLNDWVSYQDKHNKLNGEQNRDGSNDNLSWNCGVEGETDDPVIEALRERQIKNCIAILLLSRGVPMLLAGDEVRRTQQGNNNAYCQDNEVSWFDWQRALQYQSIFRFCKNMIAFRKAHPNLYDGRFYTGVPDERGQKDIDWHGCRLYNPDWYDPNSRVLACTIWGAGKDDDIHIMLNMERQNLDFEIPLLTDQTWLRAIDTALPSPQDIAEAGQECVVAGSIYHVEKHSVVVLIARR